eukprot:scaffold13688_cov59-Phaeocystis_antarctica.AAC.1
MGAPHRRGTWRGQSACTVADPTARVTRAGVRVGSRRRGRGRGRGRGSGPERCPPERGGRGA